MINKKKNPSTSIGKEKILKIVREQLQTTLTGLKDRLSEKKFEKRIKKVAKLLTKGIKEFPLKKTGISDSLSVRKTKNRRAVLSI